VLLISFVRALIAFWLVLLGQQLNEFYDMAAFPFGVMAFILLWVYFFASDWTSNVLISYFNPETTNDEFRARNS